MTAPVLFIQGAGEGAHRLRAVRPTYASVTLHQRRAFWSAFVVRMDDTL